MNKPPYDCCLECPRVDERLKDLKESDRLQWEKIDKLADAIGVGKNWVIGLLVSMVLNMLTGLTALAVILIRGSAR